MKMVRRIHYFMVHSLRASFIIVSWIADMFGAIRLRWREKVYASEMRNAGERDDCSVVFSGPTDPGCQILRKTGQKVTAHQVPRHPPIMGTRQSVLAKGSMWPGTAGTERDEHRTGARSLITSLFGRFQK